MKLLPVVACVLVAWVIVGFYETPQAEPAPTTTTTEVAATWPPPRSATTTSSTTTTVATTTTVRARTAPTVKTVASTAGRTISSTAYCQQGRMANGRYVHDGAVSSKVLPRGSRWRVLTGPMSGRVFTVEDTGSLAYFDMWMSSCPAAVSYGRRTIRIEAA